MQTLILILAACTAFLLGAQTSQYVPLPLLWGIWASVILVIAVLVMIRITKKASHSKKNLE